MTGHSQSGLLAARPPGRRSWAAVATSALVHVVMLGVLAALARVAPAPAPPGEHRPLTFVMTTPLSVPHEPKPGLRLPAPVVERGEPERRAPVDVAMPGPPPPAPKPVAHSEPAPAPPEPTVQARPILVHTRLRKTVAEMLPSPGMFNHAIVEFRLDDYVRWIDPTLKDRKSVV